jgi:catechol 2,3-dioxygenase-like lactoylglutathione lyase family enzyme
VIRRFYVDHLGFEEHGRFPWSGGTPLVFVDGSPLGSNTTHFGFRVARVEVLHAWGAELRKRGDRVDDVRGHGTYLTTFIVDPEGNKFELFWEPVPEGA